MAKIRVAQIKDLSLTTTDAGVREITIGTKQDGSANSITPLAQVNVAETTDCVITALAQSGNNLTATTKTFDEIVSGGLVLTPENAGTGVITRLTKSDNTLTAVYTDNSSGLTADTLTVMSGYTQDANGKITGTTVKSFNDAQFTEADNVISLHENVLNASTYLGKDAIAITTIATGTDAGKKQVALTINAADQVLTQDATGLKANLGLVYDSANKQIKLTGKTGEGEGATAEVIATIPATDFIKDGMLADATIVSGTWVEGIFTEAEDGETGAEKAIKFVWKTYQQGQTGQEEVLKTEYLNVESLIDAYTASNEWVVINPNTNEISHKTVTGLDSGVAHGITADVTVDSTTEKSFEVPTLTVDAAGHVVSVNEQTVTIKLPGSIDTAVQTVTSTEELNTSDKFVAVTTTRSGNDVVLTSELKTQSLRGAIAGTEDTPAVDGLATAVDVKDYVDSAVATASHVHVTQEFRFDQIVDNAVSLEAAPYTGFEVVVYQNGIALNKNEYSVNGSSVEFITTVNDFVPFVAGDIIKVSYYKANA